MRVNQPLAFAFFDVDETLISEKSMFTLLHEIDRAHGTVCATDIIATLHAMSNAGESRAAINRYYYTTLRGLCCQEVRRVAAHYVNQRLAEQTQSPYLIEPVIRQLRLLKEQGIEPVFVSGSATDFLAPLADHLQVSHLLTTELDVDGNGCYRGTLAAPPMIGKGKSEAVILFTRQYHCNLEHCYAFGDHYSDIDFLTLVGHPRIVSGDLQLEQHAQRHGWPIIPRPTATTV